MGKTHYFPDFPSFSHFSHLWMKRALVTVLLCHLFWFVFNNHDNELTAGIFFYTPMDLHLRSMIVVMNYKDYYLN